MLKHLIKYKAKSYLLSRNGLLFSILLPLILGLIFLFAFEGLVSEGKLDPARVVVRYQGPDEGQDFLENFLDQVGQEGQLTSEGLKAHGDLKEDDYLIYYLGDKPVDQLLEEGQLNAEVWIDQGGDEMDVSILIPSSMANKLSSYIAYSVFSSYSKNYNNVYKNVKFLASQGQEARIPSYMDDLTQRSEEDLDLVQPSKAGEDEGIQSYTHYFLVALAYMCFYFFKVGVDIVRYNEGYSGPLARREAASPVPRSKRIWASFLALIIPCLLVIYLLLLAYWHRDIGLSTDYGRVILICSLGTLLAIFFGMALAAHIKLKEDIIVGIQVLIPATAAFLAGLMGQGSAMLKYWIKENIPLLNRLNPVSLVADGLYQLTFYPSLKAYNETIIIMVLYILVLIILCQLGLRKVKE